MGTLQEQGWYYVDGEREKLGPLPPTELKALADRGVIRAETPVWTEGYASWVPASQVAGLVAAQGPDHGASPGPALVSTGPPPPPVPQPSLESAQSNRPARDPLPVRELRPRKGSFLFPRVAVGVALFAFLGAVVSVVLAGLGSSPLIGVLVFPLGVGLISFAAVVAYRKERYELSDSTVLCHRGGLLSDQTTELEIRNITYVKVKLPWLRYKFFGVGNVIIESAGSAEPVILRVIREPEEIYAEMRERMKRNGYDLTQQELLHEEKPAIIGVLAECFGMAVVTFMIVVLGLPTVLGLGEELESLGILWAFWILGPLFVCGALAFLIVHFLDLRRRTYLVYNDVVVYEEGFLTRENAFIPYENIADAATKRSFIDQILNLYDVLVSCQGSASEIKFRRLRQGVHLSDCIDRLVVEARRKPTPTAAGSASTTTSPTAARKIPRRAEPELIAPGEAWVADLQMSAGRVLVPLFLLFPLVPIWIAALIQGGIKLMSTRYAVRPGSIRHSYRFLTTHDREFAYDKITGLVIKENLWDRLFGTVTLRFWSIGSGQSLELAHVSRKHIDFEAIMRQIGIPAASAEPSAVAASFGPLTWVRARLDRLSLVFVCAICLALGAWQVGEVFVWLLGALAACCLLGFGYAWAFYSRQRLCFHEHHVEAAQGVITCHRYYARYRNVKKTLVTRYPGGSEGALQIFVAGEQQVGQTGEKKGKVKLTKPCSFTSGFLPNAMEEGRLVDDILCGRVDPAPGVVPAEPLDVLCESPRALGNTLFKLIVLSVLVFPLLPFLLFTIPAAIIAVKRWRYRLEADRVAATWGILYRKQASIVLDRVDSLRQNQGPLNKMFRNGNVSIMTAGSSKPDLVLANAPDFQTLYNEIRKLSQGA